MAAILAAILLSAWQIPGGSFLLALSILFGLYPLAAQIFSELRKNKRIDLGLPVVITILILIFLGDLKTAGLFVFLILLGGFFKDYILWRVKESVEGISKALPNAAFVKTGGGTVEVKIEEIRKGQIVELRSGARVPVDGVLLAEHAPFDESVVTGESRPVPKKKGDRLVAGAINLGDYAEMEAAETSANSTIALVQKLVREAQSRSAPLSKFTNVYAELTVIVTVVLCATLYLATHNLIQALALWIALVPVIFAIIVPVSTTLGISILAKHGILIKSAEAVENLTKIDLIIFDKTGTLTKGKAEVTGILPVSGWDHKALLGLAASAERYSEHHLASAIVRKAEEEKVELAAAQQPKSVKGKGITALCGEKRILLGNRLFLIDSGIKIPDDILNQVLEREEAGSTAVFMAVDSSLAGVFLIADAIRENAPSVVQKLRQMGLGVMMLSGDNEKVARKIAADLGITDVRAECLPQDKIAQISGLQKSGHKVAMVGDGINDAPALAEANVGIAMGLRGVDITLESAQAVLVHDDLAVLPEVIRSSRRIFKTIKIDLFIATAIHVGTGWLVVVKMIGILGSTLMHQASSALVLLNTARLFRLGAEKFKAPR